jgi:hypothetical protein
MNGLVKMFGPVGTDEANHGEQKFHIHDDGSFWVCREAVEPLCRVGGFVVAPDQTATVTVTASRIAELEAEESLLRAAQPAPTITRLVMPG